MPQQLQQTKQVNTSQADTLTAEFTIHSLQRPLLLHLTKQHNSHLTPTRRTRNLLLFLLWVFWRCTTIEFCSARPELRVFFILIYVCRGQMPAHVQLQLRNKLCRLKSMCNLSVASLSLLLW